ncbi:hypothetical protein Gogos_004110 [Gossypium gossypioides]|uniref:Uncharacterized protein n=1 Tax=Gossypium gossypioides TaxID=34282 RepID=A0A7J9CF60_GOSGO|nr:hypothetical protein [Gossypium gossypioides]
MATAANRLFRTSNKQFGHVFSSSSWPSSQVKTVRYTTSKGRVDNKKICGNNERKPPAVSKSSAGTTMVETAADIKRVDWGRELTSFMVKAMTGMREMVIKPVLKLRPWRFHVQMVIENGILNCRFFTMFAVVGSLLGSILCFMEGSFLIVESYLQYCHSLLSKKLDQGHIIHLLIEAIDMFLVGTAMLIFGMGLYIMFVGSKTSKGGAPLPRSNLFGLFHLKTLPAWVEMKSISQAKSKIGHAIMMILQVGVLEKFKGIPIVTSLDLACFAASVFVSSACIFLLSKLSVGTSVGD